ncbi:hypothetical protein IK146_02020 [Candidatus Saccharibacteria bacterium]|nr:hypothetical protein [Candidatus Saccharibacteria bacterium]
MAKKIKIFSEIALGFASALTLSLAASISSAHACGNGGPVGYDKDGNAIYANCEDVSEVVEESDADADSESEDIYAESGSDIESERDISHSFFLAGNDVKSSGNTSGIHFLAGNLVDFTGTAEYGAFAGNSLKVNGSIKKDLFIAGSAIELGEDALIGRDLYAAATTVLIKANLTGNAFVSGNRVVLENVTIDGDLNIMASDIVLKGKSSIAGTFKYNDSARITSLENLSTGDIVTYTAPTNEISFGESLTTKIVFLLGRLLVTIIVVAIAAKFSKRLLEEFSAKNCWKDLALGLGLLIGVPLASIFIMITVIGLPLGIVGLVVYGLFAYFASSVTGGVVGNLVATKVFKKENMHIFLKFTIGIILVELLGLIPYVGSLISGLSLCFGFGYLVHKIFRQPKTAK